LAITPIAHQWLLNYVAEAAKLGAPPKGTSKKAVILTARQKDDLTPLLRLQWNNPKYTCPPEMDIKPQHGYISRVTKDGFLPEDYIEWLVAGCSDLAIVTTDPRSGRPNLTLASVKGRWTQTFDIVVPITSDALGYVHIYDVIPKGLPPRQKKTAP